ncbi:MAG: hypothetical protein HN521_06125 [Candidatus Latescibacteria bacterium]|nr:hypothetical protein [Candidatus Latescibacterota bacterium]
MKPTEHSDDHTSAPKVVSPQMRLHFEEEKEVRREDGVAVHCVQCHKRFSQPRWYAEKDVQSKFCSATCRSNWDLETFDEPFHLVLDGRPEYRGGNWKSQSQGARKRDDYTCQGCGVTEEELGRQLDVHHKVPFRLFESPVEANQLENLTSVCPSCHKSLEIETQKKMPLFGAVKHLGQRS